MTLKIGQTSEVEENCPNFFLIFPAPPAVPDNNGQTGLLIKEF